MEKKYYEANLFQEILGDSHYKHRIYTIEFKPKVVNLIESGVSLHTISDKLKIDRKLLREWREKKESLLEVQT